MISHDLQKKLEVARCGLESGSVREVNSKRLLALNLRKLGGREFKFCPRAYVSCRDEAYDEFAEFVADFKVSQAIAVLKHITASGHLRDDHRSGQCNDDSNTKLEGLFGRDAPEIIWQCGPDKSKAITVACIDAAFSVARRALKVFDEGGVLSSVLVSDDEWSELCSFSPRADAHDEFCLSYAVEAAALLNALPPECQVSLMHSNMWAAKPSLNGGGNGRGIVLMDRLPESSATLLDWMAAVGRGGGGGANDASDGCVIQKLVEKPHLVDRQVLLDLWPQQPYQDNRASNDGVIRNHVSSADLDNSHRHMDCHTISEHGLFKYNLRLWILTSMSDPPSVWLYKHSYIDLASEEFRPELSLAGQVTNLQRGNRSCQRYWSLDDFSSYLKRKHNDRDIFNVSIMPQVRSLLCDLFKALRVAPISLLGKSTARLKRLGVDLLVDSSYVVWLIEVNVLRNEYGLRGAKGQDKKHELAQRLVEEEKCLKAALASGLATSSAWEELSACILMDGPV